MITDPIPREADLREEYLRSDALRSIKLPELDPIRPFVKQIEVALKEENRKQIATASNKIAALVAQCFATTTPKVRIL
ncbi:hypothetical protein ABTQ08_22485, partial [Acinetobacter baumannii]